MIDTVLLALSLAYAVIVASVAVVTIRSVRRTMSAEELQARIAADTTPADADRFLPPSLRKGAA